MLSILRGGGCNAICVCDMIHMKRSNKWGTPLKSYLLTVVVIRGIFEKKSRSPHNTIWIIWRARRRAWFCFQNGARLHKTLLFYRTVSVRLLKNRKQIMSNKHLLLTLSPWDLCQSTVEKFRKEDRLKSCLDLNKKLCTPTGNLLFAYRM